MRNKLFKIAFLFIFAMIISNTKVYAEFEGIIGKDYKGDSKYAFKVVRYESEETKEKTKENLVYTVEKAHGNGDMTQEVTIKKNTSSDIYVSDIIEMDFYVLRGMWSGKMDKVLAESEDNSAIKILRKDIQEPVYDGVNHVKISLKIQLFKKGNQTIKITVDDDTSLEARITINGIKSYGAKVANVLIKQSIRQYPYTDAAGKTASQQAKRVISGNTLISREKANKATISFAKKQIEASSTFNYNDYFSAENISFDFKCSQYQIISSYDGANKKWNNNFTLNTGKKYVVVYRFWYFQDINMLLYTMVYNEIVQREGQTYEEALQEALDSATNDVDEQATEAETALQHSCSVALADEGEPRDTDVKFTDVLENIESYIPKDSNEGAQEVTEKVSVVLTVITNIGMIVAVLMSAILGIKYMLGSVEEKADYKKDMIPYLVGAFLLFGICTIVKVLQQFGETINNI